VTTKHEFCDHCPGCRPGGLDTRTGKPLPDDEEPMLTINRVWRSQTSYAERKAFIEVCLHNSRDPENIRLTLGLNQKFQRALRNPPGRIAS